MPKKIGIQWFIEPLDSYTNSVIAREMAQMGLVDESSSTLAHTYRKKKVNAWRAEREFALKLISSRKKLNLKFRIFYSRHGNNGIILWKNSTIINSEKTKTRLIVEKPEIISLKEKVLAKTLTDLVKKLKAYNHNRSIGKPAKYIPAIQEAASISKSLSKQCKDLRKILDY